MVNHVMTIAGSDAGGGAGIQADLRTFAAFGVYGMAAVTAVTAQNTYEVAGFDVMSPDLVERQLRCAAADINVDAFKTGMLCNREIVERVHDSIVTLELPNLVIDPVIASSSGTILLTEEGVAAMKRLLFPRASLITPNIAEAELLSDTGPVKNRCDMEVCGRKLLKTGCGAVLVKGGHLDGRPDDLLVTDSGILWLTGPERPKKRVRGTGCTLSAAIAALLAKGNSVREAVSDAKTFIDNAIEGSEFPGKGRGILPLID